MNNEILVDIISRILLENQELLAIPFRQRAKFEGWLKFEMAKHLHRFFPDTEVEYPVGDNNIDIFSDNSFIELKTPNTNYSNLFCLRKTRPITKNIDDIYGDFTKLQQAILDLGRESHTNAFVVFVLFPIDEKEEFKYHINKLFNKVKEIGIDYLSSERVVRVNNIPCLVLSANLLK